MSEGGTWFLYSPVSGTIIAETAKRQKIMALCKQKADDDRIKSGVTRVSSGFYQYTGPLVIDEEPIVFFFGKEHTLSQQNETYREAIKAWRYKIGVLR